MQATIPSDKLGLVLKIGLFVFLAYIGLGLFYNLLIFSGLLIAGAIGTFLAAAVANAVAVRIFERGRLSDVGLGWNEHSSRDIAFGLSSGILAAAIFIGPALIAGAATVERDPQFPASLPSFGFLTGILIFGAFGEELLFRGYAFQIMAKGSGAFAALLPVSVLFAFAHANNQNVSLLGLVNTFGFGLVLGYAYLRSGSLWLPIAIHFGWNWALVVFGLNVSGFKMGVTGFVVRWRVSDLWSGGAYGPEASVLTCGVIVGLLWVLHRVPIQPREA
ncbi:MAG TPA: type II CAAX endopeptidase family protein [Bryobacteraceae bacterium]|nr:type II CAAX endopeptidase family protein [Bryobacteraceae bacterium]